MKAKEVSSVIIALFVMIALMCKSFPEQEINEKKLMDINEMYEIPYDYIQPEHSAITVQDEYMIDIFRVKLDDGVFIELDENYLGLKAEEPYPSFEKDGVLFAINAGDTIKLGKDIFAKK